MKNIIEIDALNNCTCDLISCVNDGTARIFLNIHCDVSLNPKLEIVGGSTITITENNFLYELSSSLWVGTGTLQFRIVDDNHTGNYFNISKIASCDDTLSVKQVSNFEYALSSKQKETTIAELEQMMKPDYIKAYKSGLGITCTNSYSIIPLSTGSKYGDTLEVQSDGTILVKKSCHLDINAQVYFGTGFTSGDWICAAICCNGNVNVRAGQYVDRANPYVMVNLSTKVAMDAGMTISLQAYNEGGTRGTIYAGYSDTFLHAHVMAYYA